MNPLNEQVGGSHYKSCGMQPIEFIVKAELNFIQGNVVKYITRYKNKNGKQDIEKIIHYCQLGAELYRNIEIRPFCNYALCKQYCETNKFTKTQENIINCIVRSDFANTIIYCKRIIKQEYA